MNFKVLKNFLTIKKNTSVEKISCYNKRESFMLKTISYSIVFLSKHFEVLQENRNLLINKNDIFFNNLDNALFLQYLVQDIMNDKTLSVIEDEKNKKLNTNKKIYHISNNFDIVLEFPLKMFIEYKDENITKEDCNRLKKISIDLMEKIKNNNNENVISRIGLNKNYSIEYEKKDAFEKLKKIILLKDDKINRFVLSFSFDKDEKSVLNMTMYNNTDKNTDKIFIDTNLESKIFDDNEICNIINDIETEKFIDEKVNLALSSLK